MKETPIIMSGNHPKLILDGIKTQTRRVIKDPDKLLFFQVAGASFYCPYGQVGDRLWVRETHYRWGHWAKNGFSKTGKQKWTFEAESKEVYYSDNPPCAVQRNSFRGTAWYKRPSIFMPRWASRIDLEITEVRVERVQEITAEDCLAEGIEPCSPFELMKWGQTYRSDFCRLWDSLNAKRGFGWGTNCWVWVISFNHGARVK